MLTHVPLEPFPENSLVDESNESTTADIYSCSQRAATRPIALIIIIIIRWGRYRTKQLDELEAGEEVVVVKCATRVQ